jgi:HlyD family secretion protein
MSKNSLRLLIFAAVVGAAGFFGYQYWQKMKATLPKGIASGNGRIEAKLVDITPREALRVKEIRVEEGALVHPNQVLVVMDTATLESQLAEAKLNVAATQEKEAVAKAAIERSKAQIELAKIEVKRSTALVAQRAGSQRDLDVRRTALKTTSAGLQEEEAKLRTIEQEVNVAQANVATIQTRIDDATLKSPVDGRVLYRLAEVGEVVAAGGKVLTLVNLGDVYMEIFLPSEQAARLKIGAEARITIDYSPGLAVAGYVSFVSPEAQFTPKQVETRSEREKLMFRVKIRAPEKTVESYIELIKTGVRGVGYVKVDDSAVWPDSLQNLLPAPAGTATN